MAKIVIVDSGVNKEHKKLKNTTIDGIHIFLDEEGNVKTNDDISDSYGHGTAVSAIIANNSTGNELFMIKIFEEDYQVEEEALLAALEYVYEKCPCDVLNLSLGVTQYESLDRLEDLCNKIHDRGTVIISAFDNFGQISFPAAFDNVIGVDSSPGIRSNKSFHVVKNSCVNILARGGVQRVAWSDPEFIITKGNSFATPYITCVIAEALNAGVSHKDIPEFLKANAIEEIDYSPICTDDKPLPFEITKAAVFPFNKEMHSVVRFHDRLSFEIELYDVRESGMIGSNTSIKIAGTNYVIKNIDSIDWTADFDTFLLGHNEELSLLTGRKLTEFVLEKCIEYKKNVFAFDDLSKYPEYLTRLRKTGCKYYYPQVDMCDVPRNSFDKLYYISKPVLMVCGTSSAQGKFTLQTELRDRFDSDGFKVAQVGTEPSALLYGYDAVCPIGYGANVRISDYKFVSAVNRMFFEVSKKDCDIIISGTQSGSVPYNYENLKNIPLYSMEFMMGARPDGVILCVNAFDETEYLRRTIFTIENLYDTKVFALALFPMVYENNWAGNSGLKRPITDREKEDFTRNAKERLGKEVFTLDCDDQYGMLYQRTLKYFGEEAC